VTDEPTPDIADADPAEELRLVEQQISETQAAATRLRDEIGNSSDEPIDPNDRSALITEAEQQEAILATLEERRRTLLDRLGRTS